MDILFLLISLDDFWAFSTWVTATLPSKIMVVPWEPTTFIFRAFVFFFNLHFSMGTWVQGLVFHHIFLHFPIETALLQPLPTQSPPPNFPSSWGENLPQEDSGRHVGVRTPSFEAGFVFGKRKHGVKTHTVDGCRNPKLNHLGCIPNQGINPYPTKREVRIFSSTQNAIFGGYVSSLEGIPTPVKILGISTTNLPQLVSLEGFWSINCMVVTWVMRWWWQIELRWHDPDGPGMGGKQTHLERFFSILYHSIPLISIHKLWYMHIRIDKIHT